jgi:hypothetical protein
MERVSWLFIRSAESIRVDFRSDQLAITAHGPGKEERTYTFGDESTAVEFMRLYEQSLGSSGWVLQAFVERRAERGAGPSPPADRRRRSDAT